MIVTRSPCQECKAELTRWRAKFSSPEVCERWIADARAQLTVAERTADTYRQAANVAEARVAELELALRDAIARLNAFLSAFEGDPEPSENDTKDLVVRLIGLLDG